MRDLYQDLGLTETADDSQIKSAFRKLAKKYHPDRKSGDPERFKQISEAYEVLGNPEKRSQYDQMRRFGGPGGDFHFSGQSPFGDGVDLEDLFGSFFGGFGPRKASHHRPQRGRDLQVEVTIPFTTAILGGDVSVNRSAGQRLEVKIPPGVKSGQQLRLKGQGAAGSQGAAQGDLLVKVNVAEHPQFTREGDHVVSVLDLDYLDMLLGASHEIDTVYGTVELTIPLGLQSGSRLRVKGYGVRKPSGQKGDHFVVLKPRFPENLSEQQKELLQKLKKTN